ncbi:hypothetical protein Syn7502_02443 [Synechococcus sp. PCC 7502]|uniref:hypothetical protein n=1 Tax=Synechococcus sp. PCC 7502 TaxID=1173263 RepID=UPI00029FF140|nr:hypothetical protein [Synechococcus sp. PCC 7502]AFY74425.1 hypothetical protein Syn7502_02443 [Synechococcus sp. PCC 7502]
MPEDNKQIPEDNDLLKEFESPITEKEERSLADTLDIKREDTRSNLAWWLYGLLAASYIGAFVIMGLVIFLPLDKTEDRKERYTYTKDILSLLITTQTGLIGAVLGFYFGSNRNK